MYEELVKSLRSIDEYDTGYAKLIYDAADAIEDLQEKLDDARMDASEWAESLEYMSAAKVKLEEQTRWIPVTERLPEKNGEYLITGRQGAVNKRLYYDGYWYGNWSVLAWMPLPEPYEEGDTK